MVSFKVHFLFRDFSIYMYDFRHCMYAYIDSFCVLIVMFILFACTHSFLQSRWKSEVTQSNVKYLLDKLYTCLHCTALTVQIPATNCAQSSLYIRVSPIILIKICQYQLYKRLKEFFKPSYYSTSITQTTKQFIITTINNLLQEGSTFLKYCRYFCRYCRYYR